jgi:hypothetical protein
MYLHIEHIYNIKNKTNLTYFDIIKLEEFTQIYSILEISELLSMNQLKLCDYNIDLKKYDTDLYLIKNDYRETTDEIINIEYLHSTTYRINKIQKKSELYKYIYLKFYLTEDQLAYGLFQKNRNGPIYKLTHKYDTITHDTLPYIEIVLKLDDIPYVIFEYPFDIDLGKTYFKYISNNEDNLDIPHRDFKEFKSSSLIILRSCERFIVYLVFYPKY